MYNYLFLIIFLFIYALPVHAGKNDIHFDRLSIEDGLPHTSVYDILQDRQGFIWFATDNGVCRYDGYTFTTFKPVPGNPLSISAGGAYSVYEDRSGNIWISVRNAGMNKYDPVTGIFTRYEHDPANPDSLSHNTVPYDSVYEDSTGIFWFGALNGLNRFDPVKKSFKRYSHNADNPNSIGKGAIRTIQPDPANDKILWIGTMDGGLTRFDRITENFVQYQHDEKSPDSISHNTVWKIYGELSQEGKSILWLCTAGGLDRFDTAAGKFTHFRHDPENPDSLSHNEVYSIIPAGENTFWIGTHGGGLNLFDFSKKSFTSYKSSKNPHGISSNIIHPLYYDRSGTLWIGTWGGGVSRIDPLNQKTRLYDENSGLTHSAVLSLYEDRSGIIWIGTWSGGLNRFDPETETFEHFRHDPKNPDSLGNDVVGCFYEDSQGILWVGTWGGGLNRFDRETKKFKRYVYDWSNPESISHNAVRGICEDDEGNLWLGTTSGGVNRFDRKNEKFTRYLYDSDNPYSVSTNNIWSVFKESSGTLWFTTTAGLNRFDPATERFIQYHHDKNNQFSVSSDAVINIYEDSRKRLWITTQFGLNQFDKNTGRFIRYFEEDGLPDNRIESISEDNDGNLWLGTGKGLCRFDPKTKKFTTYGIGDGMQSNLFFYPAAIKSRTGELWFGGPKGVNVIDPKRFTNNTNKPPVVLTDFQIDGKSVRPGEDSVLKQEINFAHEIILTPDISKFSFEFSALNYTVSEKNRYAYKMEGFDKNWIYTGSDKRFAHYTNLDPGEYIFRVKGSNNDGLWNEEGTWVKIIILPPWWRTWWFRISSAILLLVIIFSIHWWRTYTMKQQNILLEKEVAERTEDLSNSISLLNDMGRIAKIGGWEFDVATEKQIWTDEVYRIHEVDYDYEPTVQKGIAFYTPESIEIIEKAVQRILESGEPFDLELPFITAKGNHLWVHAVGKAYQENGKTVRVAGTFQDITDRRHTEDSLRFTQFVVDKMPDAAFWTNSEGYFIYVNESACRRLGYSREELLSLHVKDIVPNYTKKLWSSHWLGLRQKGTMIFESRHKKKNNEIFPVEILTDCVQFKGKEYACGIVRDITERKKAEESLRKSEEQFRVIFEKSPISIELYDAEGLLTHVNQACLDIFGLSDPACVKGFKLFENPNFHSPYKERAMTGETVRFESLYDFEVVKQMNLFPTSRAGNIYIDVLVTPLSNAHKKIFGYMLQIQEITERKQTENLLRENERLMSDIINFLPDATFVIDKNGKVLAWNKAMESMTGIAAKDMLGKGDYEYAIPFYGERRPILIDLALHPSPDIEKIYHHIQRCGDKMDAEHYYPNFMGKKTWLFGNACALRDSQGEIIGAIESVRDITKRKFAEIELQNAKERAEAAERVKNTFLANVSHHLRTPLNSVLGFSEIMAEDKTLSEKYQEYAAIIYRSGKNLLALINKMLEVSKLNPELLSSDPRYQHLLNLLESNDIQAETLEPEDHHEKNEQCRADKVQRVCRLTQNMQQGGDAIALSTLQTETLEQCRADKAQRVRRLTQNMQQGGHAIALSTLQTEIHKIPPDLSERLAQAAKDIDIKLMLDIIAQIRVEYPSAADTLEQLTNSFEYEKIIERLTK